VIASLEFKNVSNAGYINLPEDAGVIIGREGNLRVDGEPFLSRRHVELRLEGCRLRVKKLPQALNPVFYAGAAKDEFVLDSGESFVVGSTCFRFVVKGAESVGTPAELTPQEESVMVQEQVYAVNDRMRLKDLLALPEILRSKNANDFYGHIAGVLRLATGAHWAAVVTGQGASLAILGKDADRDDTTIRPSARLMAQALKTKPSAVFHSWRRSEDNLQATVCEGTDWAICAATDIPGGQSVLFYVAGSGGSSSAAASTNLDNTRYVGLVADMVGRSLSVQRLEEWETRLERFFSRRVVERILTEKDFKELEPKIAESTVMFFDIRGFSKLAEGGNEEILQFQRRLRKVMTAMTGEIMKEEGVVLQYMGDGILACWNVPCPDPDHALRACRAALAMAKRLTEVDPGMRCGIGIHSGTVVAGTIGSEQLFAYGIVGAVINQASRVEGITKIVEAPILATLPVVQAIRPGSGVVATPLGAFRPAGMTVALDLYELNAAPGDSGRVDAFTQALEAFKAGHWDKAIFALHGRPVSDKAARYLAHLAEKHRRNPPRSWDGVIELTEK